MKRITRWAAKREYATHTESDAEHIFSLIYMAHYFLLHEPLAPTLNREKIFSIFTFHELGEIKHGDIVTWKKTEEDRIKEREAAKEVFESLPKEFGAMGYTYWKEYEEKKSPEARFADALDKIEPLFELFDTANERSVKRLQITYEQNLSNKLNRTEEFPVMRRFVEVISNDMKARDIFWKG
jgi:putative hydrolases of HD superfamily